MLAFKHLVGAGQPFFPNHLGRVKKNYILVEGGSQPFISERSKTLQWRLVINNVQSLMILGCLFLIWSTNRLQSLAFALFSHTDTHARLTFPQPMGSIPFLSKSHIVNNMGSFTDEEEELLSLQAILKRKNSCAVTKFGLCADISGQTYAEDCEQPEPVMILMQVQLWKPCFDFYIL